ncbi:MAG: DsbA family protein [Anaerolineaceae bacterium]
MVKRENIKSRKNKDQKRQRIILMVVIGIGAVLLAAAFIIPSLMKPAIVPNPRPMADGTSMGDPNAPVKVEEFSDFQCPYCKLAAENIEPGIVENFVKTGKIHLTFVPYSFIGPESVAAAEAAYCAADQNLFWEYHDLVFANQAGENGGTFSERKLKGFAGDLNLDTTAFNECYDSGKYKDKVEQNVAYGSEKGVRGTPYFLVEDKLVDSSQLEATILQALADNGQ